MFKFLIPILIAISFPLEVLSGQFGLEVGESIESIKNKGVKLQKAENYWYYTRNLPTGNSKLKMLNTPFLISPRKVVPPISIVRSSKCTAIVGGHLISVL